MIWEEACRILGVGETASDADIKFQWMYKANLLHRDKTYGLSERMRVKAEEELKLVNQAHDFLRNPLNNPYKIPPKLEVTPNHIRFKDVEIEQKKSTTLEIKSTGGPYTKIFIDDQLPLWLKVTGVKSLTNETLPLEVTIESTGVGEPDSQYTCDLLIKLENEKTGLKDEAIVKVDLWRKAEPPVLNVNTSLIEIKQLQPGISERRTFEVSNAGKGLLTGSIYSKKPWLQVSPTTLNIAPSSNSIYTITVTAGTLSDGFTDRDYISIITNGGSGKILVKMSVVTKTIVKSHAIGELTPAPDYWKLILEVLITRGGRAERQDVHNDIERKMTSRFKPGDLEVNRDGTLKWSKQVDYQRLAMAHEGLLRKDSPRGLWEITENGRQWFSKPSGYSDIGTTKENTNGGNPANSVKLSVNTNTIDTTSVEQIASTVALKTKHKRGFPSLAALLVLVLLISVGIIFNIQALVLLPFIIVWPLAFILLWKSNLRR